MLGNLVIVLSAIGSFVFCCCLFVSNSLLLSWFCLEMSALCLVPAFFVSGSSYLLSSLFCYLIISGFSSCLIVLGIWNPVLFVLIVWGYIVKFGLFPFMGWIYQVLTSSNWLVAYLVTIVLKLTVFFLCFFLSSWYVSDVLLFSCVSSLILCSILFWLYSYSWFHCWCHISISSSSLLLLIALSSSLDNISWLYLCYFLWGSSVVAYFYYFDSDAVGEGLLCYFLYSFLLLNTPLSAGLVYKVMMSLVVFSCSSVIFVSWVVYSLSEQFYLFVYCSSISIPKKLSSYLLIV